MKYDTKPNESKNIQAYEATSYLDIEKVDTSNGTDLYIKGAEFPMHGSIATQEALWSLNILKKIVVEGAPLLYLTPLIGLTSVIKSFNSLADKVIGPYRVQTRFLSPFSRELELFVTMFLVEMGLPSSVSEKDTGLSHLFARNFVQIFEYDQAYRWRLQDLFEEIEDKYDLLKPKTWKRLATIAEQRDDVGNKKRGRVGKRSAKMLKLISYALYVPSVRKALRNALSLTNFSKLQMDLSDIYWTNFRTDYNFRGLSANERLEDTKRRGWAIPIPTPVEKA